MTERDSLDVARILLEKAGQDEALVRKIGSDRDIADEMVGFHCQQAAEKQIKAVLTAHEIPYKKSHELSYLAGLIEEHKIDAPTALEQADTLTDWAVWSFATRARSRRRLTVTPRWYWSCRSASGRKRRLRRSQTSGMLKPGQVPTTGPDGAVSSG